MTDHKQSPLQNNNPSSSSKEVSFVQKPTVEEQIEHSQSRYEQLLVENQTLAAEIVLLEQELAEIKISSGWRMMLLFRKVRLRLFPTNTLQEKIMLFILMKLGKLWRKVRRLLQFRMSWYAYAFDRFKYAWHEKNAIGLDNIRHPGQSGMVSIVLPVYNGAAYISESLDSILSQTYPEFEIIVVDDGSTDETPMILEAYRQRDQRVRVFHQKNQRLPAALTNGFRQARGEFLTWTSDDNRMKPEFLEKLVDCLNRYPTWDMVYANQDIIDANGAPLRNSLWFQGYQEPPRSEHVHLPIDPSELNVWPNNYVGAAFMYRNRAAYLLGAYSSHRFGTEDYDYWMRMNLFLQLRHVDFLEPIYDYRFHPKSLTSRDDELGITRWRNKLMVFDEFRRDFCAYPLLWYIESIPSQASIAAKLRQRFQDNGDLYYHSSLFGGTSPQRLWLPKIYLLVVSEQEKIRFPDLHELEFDLRVLVLDGHRPGLDPVDTRWDLCITTAANCDLPRLAADQGWLGISDIETIVSAIGIKARQIHLEKIQGEILHQVDSPIQISVVVCTYHRGPALLDTLQSVSRQSFPSSNYEVIVVNNDPDDHQVAEQVHQARAQFFVHNPNELRLVVCPMKGLSYARNAGIAEARGCLVSFIDDDAIAMEDWLECLWEAVEAYPQAGVFGGKIILDPPDPRPHDLKPGWEKFWSHFNPGFAAPAVVENWWEYPWGANWSAKRDALVSSGGFRVSFGRVGKDFSGGEEIAAASLINKLGYQIVIVPDACVVHRPDPSRYSIEHVKKTIVSGKLTEYRLQIDLHIPMALGFPWLIKSFMRFSWRAFKPGRIGRPLRQENYYMAYAQLKVIGQYIRDNISRFKRPFVKRY